MAMKNRFLPGFRFHPTDQELVMYYLKRKVLGKRLCSDIISELNIYDFEPSDLPDKATFKTKDQNWFFFCPRSKRFGTGLKANRATGFGYWKATGNDRNVTYDDRVVGKIKTLIFHRGKPPKGERTDWVMHEYRLDDDNLAAAGVIQDPYVLCKVYCKSGFGPKNGEQYGAPFVEEEWDDDLEVQDTPALSTAPRRCHQSVDTSLDGQSGIMTEVVAAADQVNQQFSPLDAAGLDHVSSTHVGNVNSVSGDLQPPVDGFGDDELDRMLAAFVEDHAPSEVPSAEGGNSEELDIYNQLDDLGDWRRFNQDGFLSGSLDPSWFLELNDLV